jgi:hypothetical protein
MNAINPGNSNAPCFNAGVGVLLFLAVVVATQEVVRPGRGLIQRPVARGSIARPEGFLFFVRFEPLIGPHVDTLPFAREDFAPSLQRSSALAVEEIFGALGLRT